MTAATEPNPYLAVRVPVPPTDASLGVEALTSVQCWRLVEQATFGRLAVDGADGRPNIFPLNFMVREGVVFLRSGPGTKLKTIALHPAVALEVDGEDAEHHWSVVLRGNAERMSVDVDIEASGVLALVTASPTAKHNFVRIAGAVATGRRFRIRAEDDGAQRNRAAPYRIPHVAPLRAGYDETE